MPPRCRGILRAPGARPDLARLKRYGLADVDSTVAYRQARAVGVVAGLSTALYDQVVFDLAYARYDTCRLRSRVLFFLTIDKAA